MSDLTDRMRTCAAHIIRCNETGDPWEVSDTAVRDAVDLLLEASNALETIPELLGEPMAILEVAVPKPASNPPPDLPPNPTPRAVWTTGLDTLPRTPGPPSARPNRVCPQCDSRASKKVFRNGTELMLQCPVCAAAWPYQAQLP